MRIVNIFEGRQIEECLLEGSGHRNDDKENGVGKPEKIQKCLQHYVKYDESRQDLHSKVDIDAS